MTTSQQKAVITVTGYDKKGIIANVTAMQELVDECARVGKEIGLEVRCQHEDIFKFMHQV